MENTKQMQMNLVVNASKAMTALNEENDALALILRYIIPITH